MDYGRVLLVVSRGDPAGATFQKILVNNYGFRLAGGDEEIHIYQNQDGQTLASLPLPPIYADDLELRVNKEILRNFSAYVFLTKHYSGEGVPALTAHFPGNPGDDASFGGRPREVAMVWPSLLRSYMRKLCSRKQSLAGFDLVMEATHHGPTALSKPVMFVELGSSEREWKNEDVASIILETFFQALSDVEPASQIALGFGGPHYCHKFMKLMLEQPFALAGVVPKYSLSGVNFRIQDQFLAKSIELITHVAIDWKGVPGSTRDTILRWASQNGLEVIRV